jgi:molybdopterin-guanine dinucleotide biosynthesis protein A
VVIVLACDMPFVTAPFLRHLVALVPGYDIVAPRTGRGYHPLCAVYGRQCQEAVSRRLASRDLAMIGLLEEMRTRVVEDAELDRFGHRDRLLANINTPIEHDELGALQQHRR